VDDTSVLSGNFTVTVTSDADWTIKISKPDTASPATLPQSVSGSEQDGAVIGPFTARPGLLKISYTLSQPGSADGAVNIYNVSTGQLFPARAIMGGTEEGQSMSLQEVDGVGLYIAQVDLPSGSKYGTITISQ